jgi:hypothetical protein
MDTFTKPEQKKQVVRSFGINKGIYSSRRYGYQTIGRRSQWLGVS